LADHWGPRRLEAACARALRFEEASYAAVKRILAHNLEGEILPEPEPCPAASIFARTPGELLGSLIGGAPWS
jgi:hypothetical protein